MCTNQVENLSGQVDFVNVDECYEAGFTMIPPYGDYDYKEYVGWEFYCVLTVQWLQSTRKEILRGCQVINDVAVGLDFFFQVKLACESRIRRCGD